MVSSQCHLVTIPHLVEMLSFLCAWYLTRHISTGPQSELQRAGEKSLHSLNAVDGPETRVEERGH